MSGPDSGIRWQPGASREMLQARARLLQGIRAFFAEREVMEVETPSLSAATITDPQLQSFVTRFQQTDYYLQTSPEFFMKRLLAAGYGDIYQVARVFRDDELGRHHNPEFSLLEWYRCGFDHHQLMDEVEALVQQLLNREISTGRLSYQQAFQQQLSIDPLEASCEALKACAQSHGIEIPVGMDESDKDMWLDWLMVERVARGFDTAGFTFVYDYPASQAALARLNPQDNRVAHRFELYYGELELANGFYELTDAEEQLQRFIDENKQREKLGLASMPVDMALISALESGMPDCSGVALGIDRLMMLVCGAKHISEVMSFVTEP